MSPDFSAKPPPQPSPACGGGRNRRRGPLPACRHAVGPSPASGGGLGWGLRSASRNAMALPEPLAPVQIEPKIIMAGLSKSFATRTGLFVALDGISLDIARGSFCTIVGPSGCGKTTLLRILAGLESPSAGRATIAADDPGKPLNAMVFQGDSIFPWMTVWNNAAYGLRMRGAPRAQIREVVGHYLDRTGLIPFA